jgi:hypothetical protein
MSERATSYLAFFGAAAVLYLLMDMGFDVLARVQIRGQSASDALTETIHYMLVQPLGLLLSFAPFAAIAWICCSLSRVSWAGALGLFALSMAVFAYMHFAGYNNSQMYMQQRMWTAASLAVGLIPFKSIPIVIIALGFRFAISRRYAPQKA